MKRVRSLSPQRPKPHLYCDENFPDYAGKFLKAKGYTVIYPSPEKRGIDDVAQLLEATRIKSIFLTVDKDFMMSSFPPRRIRESYGVVVFKSDDPKLNYRRMLNSLIKLLSTRNVSGRLCVVSVDKITIRPINE